MTLKRVSIYSDGSCIGNPGPGGYGVILDYQGRRKEISGGFRKTTNNRMEALAAIIGLQALKEPCSVKVHTDSKYVVDGISKGWAIKWRDNNWRRDRNKLASNWELWKMLLEQVARHDVEFIWIRGHSGHPENERCDDLAQSAARADPAAIDDGYEKPITP